MAKYFAEFLVLRLFIGLCLLGVLSGVATAAPQEEADKSNAQREKLSLDQGWLFHLGDVPFPDIKTHGGSYNAVKAGNALGAAALEYDDSDWRHLDIPHDWAVEGPFDSNESLSHGYRPRGIAWYRKYLRVEETDRGKHVELQLDAIATHSTIWFNGNVILHNWSGYNGMNLDLTPYLRYGDALNTLSIRVDANAIEGWWYEGAGMYRHAWLIKSAPVYVVTNGVKVTPQWQEKNSWIIPAEVTLNNSSEKEAQVDVTVSLRDLNNKLVTQNTQKMRVPVLTQINATIPLTVDNPALWSLESRNLYKVDVTVTQNNRTLDQASLSTGFRKIRFDAERGFFLNDQHVKLKGICMHQDHAGVGTAIPDAIWEYRLRRLKETGVNAIRFSHNAPASEVLDMIDRMGFLVMDENRNFNPSPDYLSQLEWLVKRDRHHPSIILWSVFNEEPVQGSEVGYEMVRRMVASVKNLDNTRPVTAAMNGGLFTDKNVSQAVDVVGFNYQIPLYDKFHALHPTIPLTSSEDTSGFMTREEFKTDKSKNIIASYDDDFAPWGNSHRDAWEAIDKRDFIAGGFVWTGFDYRGEPTPNEWPSVSSVFGIMDLNGFPKTAYYLHQVQWIKDRPLIYIAPHWNWASESNWKGQEVKKIRVMVMTNTESIRLLLNGKMIGEQKADPYRMNYFDVDYASGKLEAIGFNQNKSVAKAVVETTGKPVAIRLVPDRKNLVADGRDAMPITVEVVDAQGRVVPTENPLVSFEISGAGKSLGHGNGDPNSHEDEKGKTRKLFHGLAQLIVQSAGEPGDLIVKASSEGLKTATLKLTVQKTSPGVVNLPKVDAISLLHNWRVSPPSLRKPDVHKILSDNDMNSWEWGQIPIFEEVNAQPQWRLFRTYFTPRTDLADGNAKIVFAQITGKFEIWLDDQLIAKSDAAEVKNYSIKLPPGKSRHRLDVLIESQAEKISGITALVKIQH